MLKLMVFVLGAAILTCNCYAGLNYSFRFEPNATDVLPGLQEIAIYLDEIADGGSTLRLSDPNFGLGTAIFDVNISGATFSSADAAMTDDGLLTFASATPTNGDTTISFFQSSLVSASLANGTLGTASSLTLATIKVGTVRFNLSLGQSATLTIPTPFYEAANNASDFGYADVAGTLLEVPSGATLTITAVPEPTSIIFGSIVAAAGGVGAWKRRRRRSLKGEVRSVNEEGSLST